MRYIRTAVVVLFVIAMGIFAAGKWKTFIQRDPHVPVITAEQDEITVPVDYTQEELLQGMSASDEEDGDLTPSIMTGEFSPFISGNTCHLNYIVFDSANQPGVYRRKVTFEGYRPPEFTLSSPLVFRAGGSETAYGRIGAQDMLDGDLSQMVRLVDENVSYMAEGEGTVTVEVSNSFGASSELVFPVHVVPAGTELLNTSTPVVYVDKGSTFDPDEYKKNLTYADGTVPDPSEVTAQSGADTAETGVYEVHYACADAETWMTVVVRSQEEVNG